MQKKNNRLFDMPVLVVDCQATRADPRSGDLLEIGWLTTSAATYKDRENGSKIISELIGIAPGKEIPHRVQRITGLAGEDLSSGVSPKKAWKKLLRAAKKIAAANNSGLCPAVIHYSQFEEPFLRDMHRQWSGRRPFPFVIICTHQLSKLLLPHLPSKGLRATAGYFDWPVPELRRCASHIAATAFIWQKLVNLLNTSYYIHTLEELQAAMANPESLLPAAPVLAAVARSPQADEANKCPGKTAAPKKRGTRRVYPMDRVILSDLPDLPGVYRMLRANGDLLYIGKATSLRQRVNSYFRDSTKHTSRTLEMLTQAKKLEYTLTRSVVEASMLESDLIKQLSPPYNIALRLRPEGRQPVFFSPDLLHISTSADAQHPIGPLPNQRIGVTLANLILFLAGLERNRIGPSHNTLPGLGQDPAALLGLHPTYSPGFDCFLEGALIFRRQHAAYLDPQPGIERDFRSFFHRLMHLGKELHRQKMAAEAAALAAAQAAAETAAAKEAGSIEIENGNEIVSEDDGLDSTGGIAEELAGDRATWTPEAAAGMIEGIIRFGSRLIRRSRWFCLLSESCITWEEVVGKEPLKIHLLIERGQARDWAGYARYAPGRGSEIVLPVPPGYRQSFAERRWVFDAAGYDRLRVMTTELRRVLAGERRESVQLRLSPGVLLGAKELSELLQWI